MEEQRKRRKTNNLLLLLLLLFNFNSSYSQVDLDSIKIKPINKVYSISDTISLSLYNKSSEKIYMLISLEKKRGREWKLYLSDIFQKDSIFMVKNILYLNSLEKRNEYWKIKNNMYHKKNKNLYRFVFHIGTSPDRLSLVRYSTVFYVGNAPKREL